MSQKTVKNVAASHRAKLLALARSQGEDFQYLLGRWAVERFLWRLGNSEHRESFVLKGAMLFLVWDGSLHRPTRDVDLLGWGDSSVEGVRRRIQDVCRVEAADGLRFDHEQIAAVPIRDDAEYGGVRAKVPTRLDGAKSLVQVDVGFGDAVTPAPREVQFPTLLELEKPRIRAYPAEAVIAEKLEAMVILGMANTRMKDFFDLWTLSKSRRFDLASLAAAIQATFVRRGTDLPNGAPLALTDEFLKDPNKQVQWQAFVRRLALEDVAPDLSEAGERLREFLQKPLNVTTAGGGADETWTSAGEWE